MLRSTARESGVCSCVLCCIKGKHESAGGEGFVYFCQGRGTSSNEIPHTWQLKEQAGFVVSRSTE